MDVCCVTRGVIHFRMAALHFSMRVSRSDANALLLVCIMSVACPRQKQAGDVVT